MAAPKGRTASGPTGPATAAELRIRRADAPAPPPGNPSLKSETATPKSTPAIDPTRRRPQRPGQSTQNGAAQEQPPDLESEKPTPTNRSPKSSEPPGTGATQGPGKASAPVPPERLGPRPLGLHLGLAAATWLTSRVGLQSLSGGSRSWNPAENPDHPIQHEPGSFPAGWGGLGSDIAADGLGAGNAAELLAELRRAAGHADPERLANAIDQEARRRLGKLLDGIAAYQRHPYRRYLPEAPSVWQDGTSRLLDYGALPEAADPDGPPLLVVPSLINRSYILDLKPDVSFLRTLAAEGMRPLLVDWGAPGPIERDFTLSDYVAGRLEDALDAALALTGGRPPVLIGYCMGGLLALALAARRRRDLAGLALLATPWNFHADRPSHARLVGGCMRIMEPMVSVLGELPVDALQAMFGSIEPFGVASKFVAFADIDPSSAKAEAFVALEDWINDGVPLAAGVARECLVGWYGENRPGHGQWRVAGRIVDPARIDLPSLVVIPQQDRIVPPGSARPLADALPAADSLTPRFGHIGMIAGRRAKTAVWTPLTDWLRRAVA